MNMGRISKNQTLSLDHETVQLLEKQSSELHLSKSALVRLLLIRNQKGSKLMEEEH
jgi:hypothetical protein